MAAAAPPPPASRGPPPASTSSAASAASAAAAPPTTPAAAAAAGTRPPPSYSPPPPGARRTSADVAAARAYLAARGVGGAAGEPPLVLYDGACGLCDGAVRALLAADREGVFTYAPLQGSVGGAACVAYGAPSDLSTMVYVEGGTAYIRSDAPLRIAARLSPAARLAAVAALSAPRRLRDGAYNTVAANRYDWFGTSTGEGVCGVLTPEQRARFYLD
ncbi:hypothetical protein MMPV_010111 [Pyropia vietnamensis]